MDKKKIKEQLDRFGAYDVRDGLQIRKIRSYEFPECQYWIYWHGIPNMGFPTLEEAIKEISDQ